MPSWNAASDDLEAAVASFGHVALVFEVLRFGQQLVLRRLIFVVDGLFERRRLRVRGRLQQDRQRPGCAAARHRPG